MVHDKKPDLTFFRVFGALCYLTNDSEDLGKLQPTSDIGIFVGYAPSRKGYKIYNKRTRRIMETIHVQFDELSESMASVQLSIFSYSEFSSFEDTLRSMSGSALVLGDKEDPDGHSKKYKSRLFATHLARNIASPDAVLRTLDEPADVFTKALPREWFEFLLPLLGMKNNMANEHVPSPTTIRSNDQILLFNAWVPIGKAVTATADVPSRFTTTTETTSTLPPPPPPLQQSTVHRDIW
ncbi:retrovirus-related pol polyprotein from transposon TNT 1-94 [Tanacetum coccineum]